MFGLIIRLGMYLKYLPDLFIFIREVVMLYHKVSSKPKPNKKELEIVAKAIKTHDTSELEAMCK